MNYIVHFHGRNYSQKPAPSLSAAVALAKRWVNRGANHSAQVTTGLFCLVETFNRRG